MFLAEIATSAGPSATAIGTWSLLIGLIAKELRSLWKEKKDSEREDKKILIQEDQKEYLRRLEIGQVAQNGKLSKVTETNALHYNAVIEISKIRHEEMLRAVTSSCKSVPVVVQQNNQPKQMEEKV